jgi:hypothetical protein
MDALCGGVTATALFSGSESWSAPLPRLEVCGTQGRGLVCEAGRRLWLHQPRETAHLLEPPGMIAHVTAANVLGVAEDLKAFWLPALGRMKRLQPARAKSQRRA